MADNVSNQIKNLDQWIKNADNSLKHLLDTYTELNQKASNRSTSSFLGTETSKIKKDVIDAQANMKTLSDEIRKLMQTARNPKEIEALSKALKDLARSSTSFGSILTTINRSKQVSQSLTNRITQSTNWGMGALSRLNIASAYNNGASAANNFSRSAKNAKSSIESMLPTLRRLASAFGVAFSVQGLVNFGRKLVEVRGEFELQQVALRSILQNKQLADEIWDKTMQAALQSPFTAMQLTKYTKQLAAYRIETDKLFDTTKRLADVSAGLGVDMQRLILAYGQVKAANYLRASEIRQFTEAGVNILGELSKYFTETKGQMISTAQVMDMVQKRMVKFEDVEEIFKRLTDQGGIFYNMQYIQSQTVKGQINKLHDAYDQMLNSIGKANEGAIKNMVSLLNNIVKNWREWKTLLDTIAIPTIVVSLTKLGKGLFTAGSAARIASKEIKGLELAGTRARAAISRLDATMKKFKLGLLRGWGGAIAIFAAFEAVTAIWNHVKAVRAVNKEYDELIQRNYETMSVLESTSNSIEKNNSLIKNSKTPLKERNQAQKENREILSKLQTEYPELASQMSINTNGIIDMKDALEKYNAELRLQIRLQSLSKASFFDQSFDKDIQQYEEKYNKREAKAQEAINELNTEIQEYRAAIEEARDDSSKKYLEGVLSDLLVFKDAIQEATNEGLSAFDAYEKGYQEFRRKHPTEEGYSPYKVDKNYRRHGRNYSYSAKRIKSLKGSLGHSESELTAEISNQTAEYSGYLIELLRMTKDFTYDMNDLVVLSENDFLKKHKDQVQKELYTTQKDGTIVIGELGEALSEAFYKTASKAQTPAARESLLKKLIGDWEKATGLKLQFGRKQGSSSNQLEIDGGTGKSYDSISSLISLLKEMNSEYDKLSKSAYGFAKSNEKVRESFSDAFAEIFGFAGIDIKQVDTTSKSATVKAMELVMKTLDDKNMWGRFGKDGGKKARAEFEKALAGMRAEVDIELTTRKRENVAKQLEDAFGDYQLTLDLEKLQLPSGLLKDMFDIDGTDLAAMRQKLEDLSKDLTDENGVMTGDNLKLYEQWLKKLDDEERKLQQQRLKDYSKYLEYQLSDRAKLEMEYVRKVAEVQSEIAYDDTTRQRILDGLRKEYEKNIAKQDWEDFKGSEMYIEMMEDLTKQGTAALEEMRKKLLEVRDNAENLSPRALKEVINALEKIDETIYGRMTPFQAVRELRKQARGAMNENGVLDISEAFERDRVAKEEYEERRKLHEAIEENIADRQKEAELEEQIGERGSRNIDALREYLEIAREQKKAAEEHRDLLGEENKENQEEYQKTLHEIENWSIQIEQYQKRINLLTQLQSIQDKIAKSEYSDISLEDLTKMSKEELDAMGISEDEMKDMGEILKYWKLMRQAELRALDEVKEYLSLIQNIAKNTSEMLHTLGIEQNPLSNYWEQATDAAFSYAQETIEAIKQFKEAKIQAEAIAGAGEDLMTGNYIKLALRLLGVLLQVVNQIALFRGARIDKSIEDQQKRIDALTMAYERLEKQIEKAWNTTTYMRNYAQMVQNIREQITATEAQMAAARERKRVDQSEINGYQSTLYELYDQLDELEQKSIEVFGGIGEEGYRSAAEGFVEAWKSAFLETGDGLQGLQDHFDEFLQDWFAKQATMLIARKYLDTMFDQIDAAVQKNGNGGVEVMWDEIQGIMDTATEQFPAFSAELEEFFRRFGGFGEGSLSGLAAGIQGMTEEQANILEAYWNSVRMYNASIDMNVARLVTIVDERLGVQVGNAVASNIAPVMAMATAMSENAPSTNPMLQQMSLIAANTQATHQLLQSVTRSGHSLGGYGIKVFND